MAEVRFWYAAAPTAGHKAFSFLGGIVIERCGLCVTLLASHCLINSFYDVTLVFPVFLALLINQLLNFHAQEAELIHIVTISQLFLDSGFITCSYGLRKNADVIC